MLADNCKSGQKEALYSAWCSEYGETRRVHRGESRLMPLMDVIFLPRVSIRGGMRPRAGGFTRSDYCMNDLFDRSR